MGMRGHADRSRRGFTMMEMMGAVAILAIVALISVPPLMHMARQLRMMQLDAEAQQIYNSVQNRLSALKASGQAPLLFGEESLAASKVTTRPADYPAGAAFNDEQHALYHLSSDADSSVARYLFTTSDAATSSSARSPARSTRSTTGRAPARARPTRSTPARARREPSPGTTCMTCAAKKSVPPSSWATTGAAR